MSKHTVYTSVTPLPAGISRETVLAAFRDHASMIDLNPYVEERHPMKAPGKASPEEYGAIWYSITDKISYLPGISGKVTYHACFHDLPDGLQTHCYAPLGVDIRERWSVGGNEPGEPKAPPPMGIGAPADGLYIREDIDMRCNFVYTRFVKKNLRNAHGLLVKRLVNMAHTFENRVYNERLGVSRQESLRTSPLSPIQPNIPGSTPPPRHGQMQSMYPPPPQQQQQRTSAYELPDTKMGGGVDPRMAPGYGRSPGRSPPVYQNAPHELPATHAHAHGPIELE